MRAHRLPPLARAAVLALAGLWPTALAAAERPPHLHALLVFDTSTNLTPSVKLDQKHMLDLLGRTLPADRFTAKTLEGPAVTPERIAKYFAEVKPAAGDTMLFYFTGHGSIRNGGTAADGADKGFTFELQSDGKSPSKFPLARADVRKLMEAKKPRLAVLLTDCCSNRLEIAAPPRMKDRATYDGAPTAPSKLMNNLLFAPSGVADITAATRDVAICDTDIGSYFTYAMCQAAYANGGKALGWKEMLASVKDNTMKAHRHALGKGPGDPLEPGQHLQTPEALTLPAAGAVARVEPEPKAKPEPEGVARKAFGAVSLINTSDAPVKFELRWRDGDKWLAAELKPKQRVIISTPEEAAGTTALQVRVDGEERKLPTKRVVSETPPKDFDKGKLHDLGVKP